MNRFEVFFFSQLQTSIMPLRNEVKHGEIREMESDHWHVHVEAPPGVPLICLISCNWLEVSTHHSLGEHLSLCSSHTWATWLLKMVDGDTALGLSGNPPFVVSWWLNALLWLEVLVPAQSYDLGKLVTYVPDVNGNYHLAWEKGVFIILRERAN